MRRQEKRKRHKLILQELDHDVNRLHQACQGFREVIKKERVIKDGLYYLAHPNEHSIKRQKNAN